MGKCYFNKLTSLPSLEIFSITENRKFLCFDSVPSKGKKNNLKLLFWGLFFWQLSTEWLVNGTTTYFIRIRKEGIGKVGGKRYLLCIIRKYFLYISLGKIKSIIKLFHMSSLLLIDIEDMASDESMNKHLLISILNRLHHL